MGTNSVDKTKENMLYYKKKRNKILFFVYVPFVITFALYFILNMVWQIDINLLTTIALPVVIGLLAIFIGFRNKIYYYNMQYKYYLMKIEQIGPQHTNMRLYTKAWLDRFINDGFTPGMNAVDFQIYYRVSKKLEGIANRGDVLDVVVIAKNEDFDFYGEEIDKEINSLQLIHHEKNRIKKIIVLQFKKYNEFSEEVELDIDKIINFSNQVHHLVHITAGFFPEKKMVYFLCPKKRYPNKYYYYACRQLKKYCGLL